MRTETPVVTRSIPVHSYLGSEWNFGKGLSFTLSVQDLVSALKSVKCSRVRNHICLDLIPFAENVSTLEVAKLTTPLPLPVFALLAIELFQDKKEGDEIALPESSVFYVVTSQGSIFQAIFSYMDGVRGWAFMCESMTFTTSHRDIKFRYPVTAVSFKNLLPLY